MTAPVLLMQGRLSDDESELLGRLTAQINRYAQVNKRKSEYYEGTHKARNLDIAVPPHLADLEVSVGIPATVTNSLAERIEWDGWSSTGDLMGLDEVYAANTLDAEQASPTLDALICGVSFAAVGRGDVGEPEVLVTAESPSSCTALWDRRKRLVSAALSQTRGVFGQVLMESLYLPDQTIKIVHDPSNRGGVPTIERDMHNLGRVPVVRFTNQERASEVNGRSEITRPVRYLTDATARTMLCMEINREFYTAPQRYGLGVDPEQFGISADDPKSERVRKGWEAAMTRMNFIPRDEDFPDQLPQIGQFTPAPPTPYIEQMKYYGTIVAAEGALPSQYLGIFTDNPPSADAIRAQEARLVRRAAFRQRMFGRAWREVAYLSLLVRDGVVDEVEFAKVAVNWLSPKTPTPAADADETSKLVGQGILPADSPVTYRRVGLSVGDQAQIALDKRRAGVSLLRERLAGAAQAAQTDPQVASLAGQRVGSVG